MDTFKVLKLSKLAKIYCLVLADTAGYPFCKEA